LKIRGFLSVKSSLNWRYRIEPMTGEKRMTKSHRKLDLPDLNLALDKSLNAQDHKPMAINITESTKISENIMKLG